MPAVRRPKKSIIKDGIHPTQLRQLRFVYACEDCSYFIPESKTCNIGFSPSNHRREVQKASYELSGKMAICRFLEID